VDLVIICGDFQAVRNAQDLTVMSCPAKYRRLGDFHEYYSGFRRAPYLTIYIGGNHEAIAHHWELPYGGWVAPKIYYLGFANVVRFGPLRIAGISGIEKGPNNGAVYNTPHSERPPFDHKEIASFYQVREPDVTKLRHVTGQVDIFLSHDWPREIEKHGDEDAVFRDNPRWKQSAMTSQLGSLSGAQLLDVLKPAYWFSAHMHYRFEALVEHAGQGSNEAVSHARTRFLALSKCIPWKSIKEHLQLEHIRPATKTSESSNISKFRLEYDPEWLAITRAFNCALGGTSKDASQSKSKDTDIGKNISRERSWVDENLVAKGNLTIPEDFVPTAPAHTPGSPEISKNQNIGYSSPQTASFCQMLGIENMFAKG